MNFNKLLMRWGATPASSTDPAYLRTTTTTTTTTRKPHPIDQKMAQDDDLVIDLDDVVDAASHLSSHAVRTPLLESPELNHRVHRRALLKFEGAQVTGSFKFRGAYNRLSRLSPKQPQHVVAFSSGNHAQGVAAAAHQLGIKSTIVMPSDAPKIKVDRTRAWGAKVLL